MRRENSRQRRQPHREELPLLLVLCGADSTEPDYFKGVKKHEKNTAVKIVFKEKGVDPVSLVRHAVKLCENAGYDRVWCIVDVDQFDVSAALEAARRSNVDLIVSNPCFEYWLLLHFEDCLAPMSGYKDVVRRLKKYLPHYEKTELKFSDYVDKFTTAVERAKKRCPENSLPHECNPSTNVWSLVESIRR